MPAFVTAVVEDFRHGRETWPVRVILCAVALGITLLLQSGAH